MTDAIAEARRVTVKVENTASLVGVNQHNAWRVAGRVCRLVGEPRLEHRALDRALYLTRLDKHALRILGRSTKASDVSAAHLRTMIDKLRNESASGSSVRGVVTATSAMFRYAVRRGIVATNPVRLLERGDRPTGKRQTEPRYLDRGQIDRLLAKLGDEYRPIGAALAFAGLRVSEAWRSGGETSSSRPGASRSWHQDQRGATRRYRSSSPSPPSSESTARASRSAGCSSRDLTPWCSPSTVGTSSAPSTGPAMTPN